MVSDGFLSAPEAWVCGLTDVLRDVKRPIFLLIQRALVVLEAYSKMIHGVTKKVSDGYE